MAKQEEIYVKAPVLLYPREEAMVDGRNVTFRWEPVEGAVEYFLEVASAVTFDALVYEKDAGLATSLTVKDVFSTEEETYYWRVLARNDAGWSHGEVIESFISSTAEKAAAHREVSPDREEDMGPLLGLVRAVSVEAAAEATGDEDYYAREAEMGVEHENVEAGQIIGFALALFASVAVIVLLLFQWTGLASRQARVQAVGLSGYPQLREAESRAIQKLTQYEAVTDQEGVYRIPIDQAMTLMVNEAYEAQGRPYSEELPRLPQEE